MRKSETIPFVPSAVHIFEFGLADQIVQKA